MDQYEDAVSAVDAGQYQLALSIAQRLYRNNKKNPHLLHLLANCQYNLGDYREASKLARKFQRIVGNRDKAALQLLGHTKRAMGDFRSAAEIYEKLVTLGNHLQFSTDLAHANFYLGNYDRFPDLYLNRHLHPEEIYDFNPKFREKIVTRPNKFRGNILIWGEQGVGDELFYSQLIQEMDFSDVNNISIKCDYRISRIFENTFIDKISVYDHLNLERVIEDYDSIILISDLLALSYIHGAPKVRQKYWYDVSRVSWFEDLLRTKADGRKLIGISWRGGGTPEQKRRRSIALSTLLRSLPDDVLAVNLQYDSTEDDVAGISTTDGRALYTIPGLDLKNDLEGLISMMHCLDGVVSIDNTTVHLAGLWDVPTVVLLPAAPDFRWGAPDARSIFYPKLNLIRQSEPGNWNDVLEQVSPKLVDIIG